MQLLGNSNPLAGSGDRLIDTVQDVGGGLNTIAQSNQEGTQSAAVGLGETALSAITLGRAHETRRKWQDQGDNEETIEERNEERENADGFLEEAGAFNEDLKTGLDVYLDNPDVNIQDAGVDAATTVTGGEDAEDLGADLEDFHAGFEDRQEDLADAYKPKIEAGFDAAGIDAPMAETVLQEAPGTASDWFVEMPAEATITAGTGVDPETGATDADPEPLDLLDVVFVGGGKALKGGAKLTKSAKTAGVADDVSVEAPRIADSVDLDGVTSSATSGLSGLLVGGATALGGARAGKTMVKGLDEVGKLLGRASSGTDDVATNAPRATDEGIVIQPDTGDTARSVGDTGSLFDDTTPSDGPLWDNIGSEGTTSAADDVTEDVGSGGLWDNVGSDGSTSSVDDFTGANQGSDLLSGVDDTVDDGFTTAGGALDDTLSGVDDAADDTASAIDDAAEDALPGVDDAVYTDPLDSFAAGDGILNRAWRPLNNGLNRVFGGVARVTDDGVEAVRRGGDDIASGGDDAAAAGDDALGGASAADDTTSILGRVGSLGGSAFRTATRGLGGTAKLFIGGTALALGSAFALDAAGINLFGDSGDKQGVTTSENYNQYFVKNYQKTKAALFRVHEKNGDSDNQIGYSILLGTDEEGRFISQGGVAVLSSAGEPIEAQPLEQNSDGKRVFQPRFDTTEAADEANAAFFEKLQNEGYTDEDQDVPSGADGIKGSLDAPDEIALGEAFTANWEVSTDGNEEAAGRLVLAVQTPEGLGTLAETRYDLSPNAPSQDGTFEARNGWAGLDPGSQTLYAISTGNNEGVVAEDSVTITEGDSAPDRSSDSEDASWGDPEIVQELPQGWYLMAQPRTDGPEQVRFMVVGKRDDGDEIYVHPDGTAKTEAHTYPTAEEASAAFEEWAKRHQNGSTRASEQPSEDADRPSQNAVSRDAKEGSGGAAGSLARAKKAASENPKKAIAAVVITAIAGYYAYKKGYLDKPIDMIEGAIPSGVLP